MSCSLLMVLDNTTHSHHSVTLIGEDKMANQLTQQKKKKKRRINLNMEN